MPRWTLAFAILLSGSAAGAAPPPIPPGPDIDTLRTFIRALTTHDLTAYGTTLTDNLQVIEDGRAIARGKQQWLRMAAIEVSSPNRTVRSEGVWMGPDYPAHTAKGDQDQAMILERIDQIFGDCCVYHRTETLTFKDGKVAMLERSRLLGQSMQNDGRAQGDP